MSNYINTLSATKTVFIDSNSNLNKIDLLGSETEEKPLEDIYIEFDVAIHSIRNHDYTWVNLTNEVVVNEYCPKILKLENGIYVQANLNIGIWVIKKENPKKLIWKFNPFFSKPIAQYGDKHIKQIFQASSNDFFRINPTLLFTKNGAVEVSRSKISFSAIICFTDHCDFDTLENLKIQREFFKENNIKITKGFFLNHFSKRENNASFERNKEELDKWTNDNHELCYHSLSQSIKNKQESIDDFYGFIPPYNDISVWIDHGFQPYNLTLYKKSGIESEYFENNLIKKKIAILWNYIDAGTATNGVINQLNASQFTLEKYKKSLKGFQLKTQMLLLFKNILFHHDNNEKRIRNYIDFRSDLNLVIKKKKLAAIFSVVKNFIPIVSITIKTIFNWNSLKRKSYKAARYTPIFFHHVFSKNTFFVFQTIELVDFKKGLSIDNINLLIKESGICIAHTYFSVDLKHYSGKLINDKGSIDDEVALNFQFLSKNIRENKIWNPTLSEFINYLKDFNNIEFDIDSNGNIFEKSSFNYHKRSIT